MADFKSVGFDNIDDTISEVKKDIIDFTEGRLRWGSTFRIANIIAELQSGKTLFLKGIAQNLFPDYRLFYTISYALNELNEQFKNDMRPHGNIVTFKIRATKNEKHYSNLLREIQNY